jgi:hypothetical protein
MVTASANMPIGRLTRKIPRQSQSVVIRPPSTGPAATATPVTAPHMPKAVPRSLPRKLWPSSASEVANTMAPPMPWPHRDRMIISGFCARPHSSDPRVKIINPIVNSRLRP